jgi:hypothetical protein
MSKELTYYQQQILDNVRRESPLLKAVGWYPYTSKSPDTNHYLQQITLTDDEYKTLLALVADHPELKEKIETAEAGDDDD